MKRLLLSALVLALLATGGAARAAQSSQSAQTTDKTPLSYDMKAQSLLDLENLHKKFVSLAEAMPAGKYNWRPSEGARSFAEVFLHVSGERYRILNLMGTPLPSGFDGKTFEKSTTDKAQIIDHLNRSWDYAKAAINGMTNADFAKPLPKLGPDANAGDVVYILVADAHEHLGQSIAYARVNGVVPPWTVAAQKAVEKKDQQQKQ